MRTALVLSFLLLTAGSVRAACEGEIGGKEGRCAPGFELTSLEGATVRFPGPPGAVTFLNFWATWCEPCAAEMALLERLSRKLDPRRVRILTVNIDEGGKPAAEEFLRKVLGPQKRGFPVLLDAGQKISRAYGTFKVPETYIIDKTGRITDKVEGIRDWEDPLLIHYLELLARP